MYFIFSNVLWFSKSQENILFWVRSEPIRSIPFVNNLNSPLNNGKQTKRNLEIRLGLTVVRILALIPLACLGSCPYFTEAL